MLSECDSFPDEYEVFPMQTCTCIENIHAPSCRVSFHLQKRASLLFQKGSLSVYTLRSLNTTKFSEILHCLCVITPPSEEPTVTEEKYRENPVELSETEQRLLHTARPVAPFVFEVVIKMFKKSHLRKSKKYNNVGGKLNVVSMLEMVREEISMQLEIGDNKFCCPQHDVISPTTPDMPTNRFDETHFMPDASGSINLSEHLAGAFLVAEDENEDEIFVMMPYYEKGPLAVWDSQNHAFSHPFKISSSLDAIHTPGPRCSTQVDNNSQNIADDNGNGNATGLISPQQILGQGSGISEAFAVDLFHQLVLGLRNLHWRGIAHRDVKPSNVLVSRNNQIYLADFGVSKRVKPLPLNDELAKRTGYVPTLIRDTEGVRWVCDELVDFACCISL